jgi:hypothetical protein
MLLLRPCDAASLRDDAAFEAIFESQRLRLARFGGRRIGRRTDLRGAVGIRDRRCTRACATLAWNRRSRFRRSAGGSNREPFPELQSAIHSNEGHYSLPIRHMREILEDLISI